MQKVYLLLRDNKQSGPYSLEEIVQSGLRPFDLIWVEGRSCGWSYPSEISALKPYVPETRAAVPPQSTESIPSTPHTYSPAGTTTSSSPKVIPPPGSVFVSLPGKGPQAIAPKEVPSASDWDRRVEEVRQRAHSHTPPKEREEEMPSLDTHYARSLDEVEEQYTNWVYHQKSKKKPLLTSGQLSTLAIVVILVGGGYLAATSLFDREKKEKGTPLVIHQDLKEETPDTETQPVEPAVVYEEEARPQKYSAPSATIRKEAKKPVRSLPEGTIARKPAEPSTAQEQDPLPQQPLPGNTSAEEPVEEEDVAVSPQEKKKSLADKIDGFIEKIASKGRKGAQKEVEEKTPGTTPAPGTGERRSTRRGEEGTPSISNAELAQQVEVVANNSDNWMMGVKGLKLTVRNHSAVAIKSAAIEVSYYSENDNLLETKTVYVYSIPAKGRKTVAAPDQRMADRVEFKVLSASADEEAYAQQ
jgi:hypothetical protein